MGASFRVRAYQKRGLLICPAKSGSLLDYGRNPKEFLQSQHRYCVRIYLVVAAIAEPRAKQS
jgi:hypothetical protein